MSILLVLLFTLSAVCASPTVLERTPALESFDRQCPSGEAISSLAFTRYKGDIGLFVVCNSISDDTPSVASATTEFITVKCALLKSHPFRLPLHILTLTLSSRCFALAINAESATCRETEAIDFIRTGLVIVGELTNGCELGEYLAGISSDIKRDDEARYIRTISLTCCTPDDSQIVLDEQFACNVDEIDPSKSVFSLLKSSSNAPTGCPNDIINMIVIGPRGIAGKYCGFKTSSTSSCSTVKTTKRVEVSEIRTTSTTVTEELTTTEMNMVLEEEKKVIEEMSTTSETELTSETSESSSTTTEETGETSETSEASETSSTTTEETSETSETSSSMRTESTKTTEATETTEGSEEGSKSGSDSGESSKSEEGSEETSKSGSSSTETRQCMCLCAKSCSGGGSEMLHHVRRKRVSELSSRVKRAATESSSVTTTETSSPQSSSSSTTTTSESSSSTTITKSSSSTTTVTTTIESETNEQGITVWVVTPSEEIEECPKDECTCECANSSCDTKIHQGRGNVNSSGSGSHEKRSASSSGSGSGQDDRS